MITTRAAYASGPPAAFEPLRETSDFVLWKRAGPVGERRTLAEGDRPGALLDCSGPHGRRIAGGRGMATVFTAPPVIDGRLDDDAWQGPALPLTDWLTYNPLNGDKLAQQTQVLAAQLLAAGEHDMALPEAGDHREHPLRPVAGRVRPLRPAWDQKLNVIPGLGPGISRDGRVKPGHDEREGVSTRRDVGLIPRRRRARRRTAASSLGK